MTASAVEAEAITPSLRRLLDETSDLIDSPTFTHVLTRLLDASFSNLVDYRIATEAYKASGPTAPGVEVPRVTEIEDTKCKVAHILPVFCRQAHAMVVGSGELDAIAGVAAQEGLGNEYLAAIEQVHDLSAFAAVIYSSNFEYEVAESVSTTALQSEDAQPSPPAVASATYVPEPTAQVEQTELEAATESMLGESGVVLPFGAAGGSAPSGAEGAAGTNFEAAWKKALAEEDGREGDGDR